MMKVAGVSPNAHTYTSLLKGAAKTGDLQQMQAIFKTMVERVGSLACIVVRLLIVQGMSVSSSSMRGPPA